jgi:hypothetical protein
MERNRPFQLPVFGDNVGPGRVRLGIAKRGIENGPGNQRPQGNDRNPTEFHDFFRVFRRSGTLVYTSHRYVKASAMPEKTGYHGELDNPTEVVSSLDVNSSTLWKAQLKWACGRFRM